MVVDLEIDLVPDGARATRVDVRYTYTATTADGARRIARMTEAQWQEQMRRREDCMNTWLALRLIGAAPTARRRAGVLDKKEWTALLRAAGLGDDEMRGWHVQFERLQPQAHRAFLTSLGLAPDEIARIRKASRGAWARAADAG